MQEVSKNSKMSDRQSSGSYKTRTFNKPRTSNKIITSAEVSENSGHISGGTSALSGGITGDTFGGTPGGIAGGTAGETAGGDWLGGVKPVLELLQKDCSKIDAVYVRKGQKSPETDEILNLCREAGLRFKLLDAPTLGKLCPGSHNQGVLARLLATSFVEFSELLATTMDAPLPVLLCLDQVQDTGNVGTLARSLYALGGAGLVIPKHNGAYLGPVARRAAAGALELLPIARVTNISRALDEALQAGFNVYGASLDERSENLWQAKMHLPAILVLGSEESGLRLQVSKRCQLLHIPMLRVFNSLNVAQAGAVIMGEMARIQAGLKA